jgi:Thioesterase-like superfamily
MTRCYYRRLASDGDAEVFDSTDLTRSNWSPDIQHGSPPLALLTKAIEQLLADSALRIGRLTLDILGAIPVAQVRVRAWIERPGKRICLLVAEMTPADGAGRAVARVTAWALSTSDSANATFDRYPPLVEGETLPLPQSWWNVGGYLDSVEFRPQADDPTGKVFWLTSRVGLVDDEPTTALERMAMVVDSANGVGAALDPTEYLFMNTDTAVHLHRLPAGNDFALRSRGSIGPDGIGVTTAEIFDRHGFIGTSAQTLLIQKRP